MVWFLLSSVKLSEAVKVVILVLKAVTVLAVVVLLGIAAVLVATAFPGAALAKEESGAIVMQVVKEWDDASNADGNRPDTVRLRVKFDAVDTKYGEPIDCVPVYGGDDLTAEGPDGVLGTDDDWKKLFEDANLEIATKMVDYDTSKRLDAGFRVYAKLTNMQAPSRIDRSKLTDEEYNRLIEGLKYIGIN